MGSGFSQGFGPSSTEGALVGGVPPGYGDPDFGEDQVKHFLKAQKQSLSGQQSPPKWGQGQDGWTGPSIPAGPSPFTPQTTKQEAITTEGTNEHRIDKSGRTPERETTPTPDDNMDFGEDQSKNSEENSDGGKPLSQRMVYEKLQEKQKERKASLETEKETNPMFKEDNWYSSEEESEEKSDRSFSGELLRTPANQKENVDEKPETSSGEGKAIGGILPLVQPAVTALACRDPPSTPPPPPTLSASDRNNMEAAATSGGAHTESAAFAQNLTVPPPSHSFTTSIDSTSASSMKRDPR